MGREQALTVSHLRATLVALLLGALVVARGGSLPAAAGLTLAAAAAARHVATRVAVGVLGVLTLVGVPWVATPFVAGIAWLVVAHRGQRTGRLRTSLAATRGTGAVVAILAGLVAGLVAVPFARQQVSNTPIVFGAVQPSTAVIVAAVVGLALANAVGEELLWRGALDDEVQTMTVAAQYAIQAVSFGLAHWHGLPGGWTGCLLTGAASTLFLWLHRRWGICTSILAHVVADIVIFTAVLPLILFIGWMAP